MASDGLQAAKKVVLKLNAAIDESPSGDTGEHVRPFVAADYHWRGMHPFNELHGVPAVAAQFWDPLKKAIGPIQRRPDIFLAGQNQLDGGDTTWVVEMGHWMGLWVNIHCYVCSIIRPTDYGLSYL